MYTSSILNKELPGPGKRKISKKGVCLNFNSFLWIMTNTFIDMTLFMNTGASCLSNNRAFSQNNGSGGPFIPQSTEYSFSDIPKSVLGTHIHISSMNIVGLDDSCRSLPTKQFCSNT